jgi:hypothetical protein
MHRSHRFASSSLLAAVLGWKTGQRQFVSDSSFTDVWEHLERTGAIIRV